MAGQDSDVGIAQSKHDDAQNDGHVAGWIIVGEFHDAQREAEHADHGGSDRQDSHEAGVSPRGLGVFFHSLTLGVGLRPSDAVGLRRQRGQATARAVEPTVSRTLADR